MQIYRLPNKGSKCESPGKRRRGRPDLRWETYIGQAMADTDLREGDWNVRELQKEKGELPYHVIF